MLHYVGDFFNVLNRSPTSQTYYQHISSLISVTNIDVTTMSFCIGNPVPSIVILKLHDKLLNSDHFQIFDFNSKLTIFPEFTLTMMWKSLKIKF